MVPAAGALVVRQPGVLFLCLGFEWRRVPQSVLRAWLYWGPPAKTKSMLPGETCSRAAGDS